VGVDFISSIHWRGREGFEPDVWRTLRHLLRQSRTFIDIGSHIGFYTVLAHRVQPELVLLAFEPVPELFAAAGEFLTMNGVPIRALHQVALGDRDGEATLFLPIDYMTTGSLEGPFPGRECREIPVMVKRLDSFLEMPLPAPVTIKLDVEDFEYAVLKGAKQTIAKYRPYIVCELLPREHHNAVTINIIFELDYAPFAITRDGCFRMSREDFTRERPFRDFVLIPSERVAPNQMFVPFDELGLDPRAPAKKVSPR
jgi:FkbM family methyltransferase